MKKAPLAVTAVDPNMQAPDGGSVSSASLEAICERSSVDYDLKYALDLFMDSASRDGKFEELFREVNEINVALARFKTFFNGEGYFQQAAYNGQNEFRLSRSQYTDCLKVVNRNAQLFEHSLLISVWCTLD